MKKFNLLAIVLALSLVFSACSSSAGKDEVVGKEDKDTLVVAAAADARSIDPHGAGDSSSVMAVVPVVETLIANDAQGELVPALAESWEQIDNQTWKFNLRKGVKFHNGEEMKASDVVFSFKRALSDKGSRVQYIMNLVDPNGFKIIDDYTVVIKTIVPFSPFIDYLPYVGASVISEKAYSDPAAETHPVGTGPFKFVSWEKGSRLSYERNDEYWGTKAAYKNLVFKVIPEANSRMIELETGKADIAMQLTANEMGRLKDSKKLNLMTAPTTIFTAVYFNTQKAPFDNPLFRSALDYAVDSAGIVQSVHRGAARLTPGPITPGQKYYDESEPNDRYDVEKAKKMIAESGVDTSRTFKIYTNDNQSRIDLATILQNQLKEVGIKLEIEIMETAAYYDFVPTMQHDMAISGWGAVGFKDPDNNLYGPFHSSGIPDNNSSFYKNAELDAMLDKSRLLNDGPEREKLCHDIQKLLRNEAPLLSFDNPINIIGTQKYIEGFEARPTAHQFFHNVIIK